MNHSILLSRFDVNFSEFPLLSQYVLQRWGQTLEYNGWLSVSSAEPGYRETEVPWVFLHFISS